MAFTDEEKVRIRYHLGYMNVEELYTFALGVGHSIPHQSVLEGMMNRIIPAAEALVRELIARCDETESQNFNNQDAYLLRSIGDIVFRDDAHAQLNVVYMKHRAALANMLSVEPNPYDQRFTNSPINAPVRHG